MLRRGNICYGKRLRFGKLGQNGEESEKWKKEQKDLTGWNRGGMEREMSSGMLRRGRIS